MDYSQIYDPNTYNPDGTVGGAAFGVATMVILAALALVILKKSGFRAMVAVGSGG